MKVLVLLVLVGIVSTFTATPVIAQVSEPETETIDGFNDGFSVNYGGSFASQSATLAKAQVNFTSLHSFFALRKESMRIQLERHRITASYFYWDYLDYQYSLNQDHLLIA